MIRDDVEIVCVGCDDVLPLDADNETVLAAQLLTFLAAHGNCEPMRVTMQVVRRRQHPRPTGLAAY